MPAGDGPAILPEPIQEIECIVHIGGLEQLEMRHHVIQHAWVSFNVRAPVSGFSLMGLLLIASELVGECEIVGAPKRRSRSCPARSAID